MVLKVCENVTEDKKTPAKRVSIISIKMVREGSILYGGRKITSPSDAADFGRRFLEECDREELWVCCLDTKNQPIAINKVSVGSINSSIVHCREVFKPIILSNSNSFILYHNHPSSGDPTPSAEDISITHRLKEAGKLICIELIDHIIIGSETKFCSLKEKGIL
ncbi:DNA repair protein RadC [Clostridium bowmanii]|nr:DNA repair protein RadC [Clostridium bowmanii]MCA1072471.1 DNA repair protein RadC [Clostridium bowmanii]